MAAVLDYRQPPPPEPPPKKGTLAWASRALVLVSCAVEVLLVTFVRLLPGQFDEAGALLGLALILIFVAWLLGVVFGIAAFIDHDGPRTVAADALLIAGAQVAGTLLMLSLME